MTIKLSDLTKAIKKEHQDKEITVKTLSNKDIAVIGLSCQFAGSNNKDEYWESLKRGEDHIREFPYQRKKLNEAFLKTKEEESPSDGYFRGGFLDEVDKFDNEFFAISPFEATLMDPNQRMFLENAWRAIEDAGYGGDKLVGSKTGVFLGHSTDFGISYKQVIETLDPSNASFSISGNLHSIIASRISYLLDLKGPSILVDTACSSSLVALHTACRSIRNGECDKALVGATKVDILPLNSIKKKEDEIGITSSDGKARTFDDSTEGTGLGEGVGVVMLKPLDQAIQDNDNIYAVIKGSAINQDGSSVNLTSPNPVAQEDVIVKAWKDAGINPETITYIEAHGTGTRIGDVIELKGIDQAFKRYTTKKQFCGIGSVKTNMGHLDNAAGIAGFIKVVLALKHKKIPPTIHFKRPNRKINFEESPVYINDILRDWVTEGYPRRCGISAFGLSGTNCHIILEEGPEATLHTSDGKEDQPQILTLSAKDKEGIFELLWQYQKLLSRQPNLNLKDLCYTQNVGRNHYSNRLAIIFDNIEELNIKLEKAVMLNLTNLNQFDMFYNQHKIISEDEGNSKVGELTQNQKTEISNEANSKVNGYMKGEARLTRSHLKEIATMYVNGGDVDWNIFYGKDKYKKLSLPTYPYSRKTHWIKPKIKRKEKSISEVKEIIHPLFEKRLTHSFDSIIYLSYFNVKDYWILNEHKVGKTFVVPGTTYLEMVTEVIKREYPVQSIKLKDVVFLSPLILEDEEADSVEVHTVIKKDNENLVFMIVSRGNNGGQWNMHVEGKVLLSINKSINNFDVEKLKMDCSGGELKHYPYREGEGIETGQRWDCVKESWVGEDEIFALISINEKFNREIEEYNLHPALLDEAANLLLRSIGEDLYLPFSYKGITILGRLPQRFYCYIKKIRNHQVNNEFPSFNIILMDELGNEIVGIEDYRIKKTDTSKIKTTSNEEEGTYQIMWEERNFKSSRTRNDYDYILAFKGRDPLNDRIINIIKEKGKKVIEVEIGEKYQVISQEKILTNSTEQDFIKVFQHVKNLNISQILYMNGLCFEESKTLSELEKEEEVGVRGLFKMTKALGVNKLNKNYDIVLLGYYGSQVLDTQEYIKPLNAALFGFGKVINLEYPKLKCRGIDVDQHTPPETIVAEIFSESEDYLSAYRGNKRYIPLLDRLPADKFDGEEITIKDDGVYIITGGSGGLGLEVTKFLASKGKVNIALINRSILPKMDEWNSILNKEEDFKLKDQIRILNDIKESGASIDLYSGDISDIEKMTDVIDNLRSKYGRINGIFHCAGVAGDGFIQHKDDSAFNKVLAPKVKGTWVLDKLTEKDNLDFFIMFSSITSLFPEAGQCDYVAANSFLDSFSYYRKKKHKTAMTINWPAWQETGMAVNYNVDFSKEIFNPIKNQEAVNLLNLMLNRDRPKVIAGELNYNNFINSGSFSLDISPRIIKQIINRDLSQSTLHSRNNSEFKFADVTLKGRDKESSFTESEKKIGSILGDALGLNEINIYDEFLELGGNSIVAVKVEMEMEKNGVNINSGDLYAYKTVKSLAEFIDKKTVDVEDTGVDMEDKGEVLPVQPVIPSPLNDSKRKVLDNIQPFNDIIYKGCFFSALFPAITHLNRELIQVIINDTLVYDEVVEENGEKQFTVNYIPAKPLPQLLEDISLGVNTKLNSENIVEELKTSLDNDRPAVICVDCYYESIRKDKYNKLHWPHNLLVYGYDEEGQTFNILEHKNSESPVYEKRVISYSDISNSYNGFLRNFENLNLVKSSFNNLEYEKDQQSPTYFELYDEGMGKGETLIVDKVISSFRKTMLANAELIFEGLEKLNGYKNSITEVINNEDLLKDHCEPLLTTLNTIINAKLVEEYRIKKLFSENNQLVLAIEEIIKQWNRVRNTIAKYSFSTDYNQTHMDRTIATLEKVYQLEYQFYKELISYLSELN